MASITGYKRKVSSRTADTLTKRPATKSEHTPKEKGTQADTSIVSKPVDCSGISCSACHLSISPEIHSRVEIKSSPPPVNKSNTPWILEWSADWSATLHAPCWEDAYKTARARGKNKMQACEKKMILEGAKTVEKFDSLEEIKKEASKTASLILAANHCICFTGAGISTSAGIGDYRGKDGKWTLEDRHTEDSLEVGGSLEEGVAYEKLIPTYTHEAIALLVTKGLIRHVISQNGDGLHLLSGIAGHNLSELHGNVFLEKCEKCGRVYERDQYTLDDRASQHYEEIEDFGRTDVKLPRHAKKCPTCGLNHRTGRRCTDRKCRGYLKDTIINFGDLLDDEIISRAETEAKKNDFCLSLGSTMQVYPACDLVGAGQTPVRLAVCNRQETQFDSVCYQRGEEERLGVRVFGDCDVFMKEVMKQLIPSELEAWEEKRSERVLFYSSKRLQD